MTIVTYDETSERINRFIADKIERAKIKHPESVTFLERWRTVHKELYEVLECLERGDFQGAVNEWGDTIAPAHRGIEELVRYTGAKIP